MSNHTHSYHISHSVICDVIHATLANDFAQSIFRVLKRTFITAKNLLPRQSWPKISRKTATTFPFVKSEIMYIISVLKHLAPELALFYHFCLFRLCVCVRACVCLRAVGLRETRDSLCIRKRTCRYLLSIFRILSFEYCEINWGRGGDKTADRMYVCGIKMDQD